MSRRSILLVALAFVACVLLGPGEALPAEAGPLAYVVTQVDASGALPGEVQVFEATTKALVTTIMVGSRPGLIAVSPDGSRAYVANRESGAAGATSTVTVIDTGMHVAIETITIPGSSAFGLSVSPDGGELYVTNQGSSSVSVVDLSTSTVVANIGVGTEPFGVDHHPDGTRAYVTNFRSGTVSVIDTGTRSVVRTISVGSGPNQVAITPDGTRGYVTLSFSGGVRVLDVTSDVAGAFVATGSLPSGVALTSDGARAYVGNATSTVAPGSVAAIDTATDVLLTTVPAGIFSSQLAVSPDDGEAWVVNEGGGSVTVVDTTLHAVVTTIATNPYPQSVAFVEGAPAPTAEELLADAGDLIGDLVPSDFRAPGHATSAAALVDVALALLAEGEVEEAIEKIDQLLARVDGCPLRGSPDMTGPGADWVVDCDAQAALYALLLAARDALTG